MSNNYDNGNNSSNNAGKWLLAAGAAVAGGAVGYAAGTYVERAKNQAYNNGYNSASYNYNNQGYYNQGYNSGNYGNYNTYNQNVYAWREAASQINDAWHDRYAGHAAQVAADLEGSLVHGPITKDAEATYLRNLRAAGLEQSAVNDIWNRFNGY